MQNPASGRDSKRPHPEDIKAAIRKTGVTVTDLAVRLGYSRGSVSRALYDPWPAVEKAIAQHLGVTPQSLWPDRYDRDGHPLSLPASKRSRAAARRLRRKSSHA